MSELKSVLKGFLKTLILLVKPFGLLAKSIYRGLNAIFKSIGKAFIYLMTQLWISLKWLSSAVFKTLIKPLYLVIKVIVQSIYRGLKWVGRLIYRWVIHPFWVLLKKIYLGFRWVFIRLYEGFKWVFIHVYHGLKYVFIKLYQGIKWVLIQLFIPIRWVFTKLYRGMRFIIIHVYRGLRWVIRILFHGIWTVISTIAKKVWWVCTTLFQGVSYVVKNIYRGIRWVVIQCYTGIRYILKHLWEALWFIIKHLSTFLWRFVLKPLLTVLKWIILGIKHIVLFISKYIEKIAKGIQYLFHQLNKLFQAIGRCIKHIFIWFYERWLDVLKGIRWVFIQLWKGFKYVVKTIYRFIQWLVTGIWDSLVWFITKTVDLIRFCIDGLVYIYRNRPEWFYRSVRWSLLQGFLLLYTLLIWLPRVILLDGTYQLFYWTFYVIKKVLIWVITWIQKGFIVCVNAMVLVKRFLYPIKRLMMDLVFDFKDYYYVVLLLPILLPILLILLAMVLVELVFVHLWLILKVFFHLQSGILTVGYIPSWNVFTFSKRFMRNQRLSIGYQKKWRHLHTLMILFAWPLMFPIRWAIAILLLPWSLVAGLFYGLQYIRYHDQIEFIVDDFIRIPNQVEGVIDGHAVRRYGHDLTLDIPAGIYDKSLERWVIDPHIDTFKIDVLIDGLLYQSYTIKNKSTLKTTLLYQMNQIQKELGQYTSYRIPLPQVEGIDVVYELTHRGDELYQGDLMIRPFSNHTDLMVKIDKDGLSYERELDVHCIHTTALNGILLQSGFYGYEGLSILRYLDPKLDYELLPNPHLKGTKIHTQASLFDVPFKVVGLDEVYQIRIQVLPFMLSALTLSHVVFKPELDVKNQGYPIPESVFFFGKTQAIEWTVDGMPAETFVSLDTLPIQKKHVFYVRTKEYHSIHEKTYKVIDPRYRTDWWIPEFEAIKETRLQDTIAKKHIHLPIFGLKKIKCLYWVSKNPQQMKSTGLVKQPGITTFKVVLYKHLFVKKVIFLDIKH